jgi:hypothetical protein
MAEHENIDCDVRGSLTNILSEQISRLVYSGSLTKEGVKDVMNELHENGLMPEQIDLSLAKELRILCVYKYDDIMPSSNRLGGWGISMERIQTQMERLLKVKLGEISTILRLGIAKQKEKF